MIDIVKNSHIISFKKEGSLVLIIKMYRNLHAGVMHIQEYPSFFMLGMEERSYCFEKIKSIVGAFEKNKGEVLRFVYAVSDGFETFVKVELNWEEKKPTNEKSLLYHYYNKIRITNLFVSYEMKRLDLYERDLCVLEGTKKVIDACKQRDVISGHWDMNCFTYYFYKKKKRKLFLTCKNGQYCLQTEEEIRYIKNEEETQEALHEKIVDMLAHIKKKERLHYLYEEENASLLFFDCIDIDNFEEEHIEELWKKLRKIYSYDEMERESLLYIENKKMNRCQYSGEFVFGTFASHCFSWDQNEDVIFVAENKQELFNEMMQHKQKKWDESFKKIENRKGKERE